MKGILILLTLATDGRTRGGDMWNSGKHINTNVFRNRKKMAGRIRGDQGGASLPYFRIRIDVDDAGTRSRLAAVVQKAIRVAGDLIRAGSVRKRELISRVNVIFML